MELQLKSAREMFEELGYKKYIESTNLIEYIDSIGKIIRFNKSSKSIEKFIDTFDYDNCHYTYGYLSLEELQAINKQVEELGWNNE